MDLGYVVGLFIGVFLANVVWDFAKRLWARRRHGTVKLDALGDDAFVASCKCGWVSGVVKQEEAAAYLAGHHIGRKGL